MFFLPKYISCAVVAAWLGVGSKDNQKDTTLLGSPYKQARTKDPQTYHGQTTRLVGMVLFGRRKQRKDVLRRLELRSTGGADQTMPGEGARQHMLEPLGPWPSKGL